MRYLMDSGTSSANAHAGDGGAWPSRQTSALRNIVVAVASVVLVATSAYGAAAGTTAGTTHAASITSAPAATCTSSVGPGIPPPASVPSGSQGFHASWYGQSGYPTLCAGERSTATVAYYNSGSLGWVANRMGEMAFLGTWDPSPGQDKASALGGDGTSGSPSTGWPRYNRVAAQPAAYVGPGQVSWFQFTILAPSTPGMHKLYIRPLIEGATWMEDFGVYWQVTVKTTDPEYGLLTRQTDSVVLRTETNATPVRTLAGVNVGGFDGRDRSHDGRRLGYWTESGGAAELHVLELPSTDRVVARFPNLRPGAIAWAAGDGGLLVSLAEPRTDQFVIPRIVMAVDLASGQSREVHRGTGPSGASVIPLAWRRAPETFAVYETGPGGQQFGYTVIRPGSATMKWEPDGSVIGMAASSDGAQVLGLWLEPNAVRVWPIENFASQTEFKVTAPERLAVPRWWPELREVVYARGTHDGAAYRDSRIERWNPSTGGLTVVRAVGTSTTLGGYHVRADGSGIVVQRPDGAREVTTIPGGQTAAVPVVPGEQVFYSVTVR
jgi:hypothetical protein